MSIITRTTAAASVALAALVLGANPAVAQGRGGHGGHAGFNHGGYSAGHGWSGGHGWHGGNGRRGGYAGHYRGYRGGNSGWGAGLVLGGIGLGIGLGSLYYNYGAPIYPGYAVTVPPPVTYYGPPPVTYYSPPPVVYSAPPQLAPPGPPDPIFYPEHGQSSAQTEADERGCNRWATTQPSAMNDAQVFQRATLACMRGRGYTVG